MPVLQTLQNEIAVRTPARMAPLAKLPVFWSLAGQRVIVAGGSDACAWKAELLAASGAKVEIYAEQLSEACAALVEQGSTHPKGALSHRPAAWHEDAFAGSAIAVADCDDETEARLFFEAAQRAGVPVNVIDKPAFCQFQFGSIVNRSPVVVSISTDGAAPILAQAIRRRIETLLPASLKSWAALAQSLREEIALRLKPGAERRAFWERFVDRAFGAEPTEVCVRDLLVDMERPAPTRPVGRVTLVGAGPGDAEYLTLKAVRALQAADVILFDDLVSDEVLELARREAKRLLVGKRGGRTSCRQEDINEMMLTFAKAGKNVARLKSGDPMIFGRAGEEIAYLKQHNISVEVIPGITAASAMASRLGVSLTHRDHAQAVQFVTGHSRHGDLPETIDWQALADTRKTTIFYMGGRTAGAIQNRLIEAGLDAGTPVVIVSSVANTDERRWAGSLDGLSSAMAEIGLDRPVLIGVGEVFAACHLMAEVNLPLFARA
ncbi:siroheme synthase CysG [Rhizobium sp. WYJ-E13]|uniref:siroheme synthase CysG n=1 Tax=Rhizobium sp. WYJ-E13 TaxID=2849093 RepID=UPI001C1EC3EB|nr:siroheme synthase CysG [Rhizobium sp. WYJ-E13]QWW71834.1 siroheme synthase CysG [Rhizobium sp. WYJ-E13]